MDHALLRPGRHGCAGRRRARLPTYGRDKEDRATVHIKKIAVSAATMIWKLEGRLAGEATNTARRELERFAEPGRKDPGHRSPSLYLDLGAVSFVDDAGIALLRESVALVAGIIDCQEYVRTLLHENGLQSLLTNRSEGVA
jgi:hypothetical protein